MSGNDFILLNPTGAFSKSGDGFMNAKYLRHFEHVQGVLYIASLRSVSLSSLAFRVCVGIRDSSERHHVFLCWIGPRRISRMPVLPVLDANFHCYFTCSLIPSLCWQ